MSFFPAYLNSTESRFGVQNADPNLNLAKMLLQEGDSYRWAKDVESLWDQYKKFFHESQWRNTAGLDDVADNVLGTLIAWNEHVGAEATKILADAAGAHKELRHKYYSAGILSAIQGRLFGQHALTEETSKQCLRLLGNSIDEESGDCRRCISPHLERISHYFSNAELAGLAIGIILNLCAEEGPERDASVRLGIDTKTARALHDGTFTNGSAGAERAVSFLESIASDLPRNIRTTEPLATLKEVLKATKNLRDVEELVLYAQHVAIIAKYLETDIVRIAIAKRSDIFIASVNLLMDNTTKVELLHDAPEPLRTELVTDIRESLFDTEEPQDDHAISIDNKLIKQLLGTDEIGTSLVAISQLEEYRTIPGEDLLPELKHLAKVLEPSLSQQDSGRTCATLMLGNIARNPQASAIAVHELKIHHLIMAYLSPAGDRTLIHAATQSISRLAIAEGNRLGLGQDGMLEAYVGVISLRDPRMSPDAAGAIRILLTDSVPNIERFIAPVSGITSTRLGAWNLNAVDDKKRSLFDYCLGYFLDNTDLADLAIGVVEMVKTLHKGNSSVDANRILQDLLSYPEALSPLFKLLQNDASSYPCQRSLFALGLISQSDQGARKIIAHLNENLPALQTLQNLATESNGIVQGDATNDGQAKADTAVQDNLRIILHGLREVEDTCMNGQTKECIEQCWHALATITRAGAP